MERLKEISETKTTGKLVEVIQRISYQLRMPKKIFSDGGPEFKISNQILGSVPAKMGIKHIQMSE